MTEQLFLCGLSHDQRKKFDGGQELNLNGPQQNVRLNLDDVRKPLWDLEPPHLTDLAEIASYVFAADCAVRRGGKTFPNMGEDWRRTFRMVVAVREPGQWQKPGRLHALTKALKFLSDDTWIFEFVPNDNPAPLQGYLNSGSEAPQEVNECSIVLFSGGLDSFAGAVHELNNTDGKVILVSRKIVSSIDGRQRELAGKLKDFYGDRVMHVPVEAGLTIESRNVEYTQRTRTFLLSAIATVTAAIEGARRIRFFENGIMSINLPISTQLVGTRASRSTHPYSLFLLQELMQEFSDGDIAIDNPFIWMTKAETLAELMKERERDLIRRTISCSRTRDFTTANPHCGTCAQCVQRRISTLASGLSKYDPALGYETDLLKGPRQEGEERAIAIDTVRLAFEIRRLTDEGVAQRFVDELSWVALGLPEASKQEVAGKCVNLFRRYGSEVHNILTAAIREDPEGVVDRTFPKNSLLEFVVRSSEFSLSDEPIPTFDSSWTLAGNAADLDDETLPADGVNFRIALDTGRKRVRIEGLGRITGSTEYLLMTLLIDRRKEDLSQDLAPENYGALSYSDLIEQMIPNSESNIRQAVSRIRRDIATGLADLDQIEVGRNAFIETLPKKAGYRLGRRVLVVGLDQLRN